MVLHGMEKRKLRFTDTVVPSEPAHRTSCFLSTARKPPSKHELTAQHRYHAWFEQILFLTRLNHECKLVTLVARRAYKLRKKYHAESMIAGEKYENEKLKSCCLTKIHNK